MKRNDIFEKFGIMNNFALKFISLIFAILLWIFVMDTENPIIERELSGLTLTYLNQEVLETKNLDISSVSSPQISVVVFGRRDKIVMLDRQAFIATVDLKNATLGSQNFNVQITSPDPEILIRSTSHSTIEISFDRIESREFKVETLETGELPENRFLHQKVQEIDKIVLRGPKRYLDSVQKVFSALDLTKLNTSKELFSPILVIDAQGRQINELKSEFSNQKFNCIVYKKASIPVNYQIEGDLSPNIQVKSIEILPKNLVVFGEVSSVEKMEKADYKFIIDSLSLNSNISRSLELGAIDDNIQVRELPNLFVKIDEFITKEFTLGEDNISFIDLNEQYQVNLMKPFSHKIRLYGEKSELSEIADEDIKLVIGLKNLSIGEYNLEGRTNMYQFKQTKFMNEDGLLTDTYKIADIMVKISKKEEAPQPIESNE